MRWLSDDAVARLRDAVEIPDLDGTRYEIVRELGRGGMGVVYEVRDRELDRSVAMKVTTVIPSGVEGSGRAVHDPAATRPARPDASTTLGMTYGEARTIAALEHPGIVPVHDAGALPDGRFYYTMKLVRGTRLDAYAREHSRNELLRVFTRVCEAVAFAHAAGVVHRDLKPENVMVGEFGAVLVMDWGVAARANESAGVIAGTRGYMAPEQERGESLDARADVYALGAMLQFLLQGDRVPRALQAIANKALSIDKAQRYATARDLGDDVVRHLDGEPVTAYRENVVEITGRWLVRYRALVGLIAAYLVMRAIVLIWFRL